MIWFSAINTLAYAASLSCIHLLILNGSTKPEDSPKWFHSTPDFRCQIHERKSLFRDEFFKINQTHNHLPCYNYNNFNPFYIKPQKGKKPECKTIHRTNYKPTEQYMIDTMKLRRTHVPKTI